MRSDALRSPQRALHQAKSYGYSERDEAKRQVFLEQLAKIETCLIKCLKPGQWLIIDNATFHKGGRIAELIQQAGCQVLYLPPYSPDFNKIEQC